MLKVIIVEGFEFVGKSTYIRKLVDSYNLSSTSCVDYRPNYEKVFTSGFLPTKYRGLLGLSQLEFLIKLYTSDSTLMKRDSVIVFDRGILSSIVYTSIKDKDESFSLLLADKFTEIMKMPIKNGNVELEFHLLSLDADTREERYESAMNDSNHYDEYDEFESFEDYSAQYHEFMRKFNHSIELLSWSLPDFKVKYIRS